MRSGANTWVVASATVALLLIAGCSGSDDGATSTGSASASASEPVSASPSESSSTPTASATESVDPQAAEIEAVKADYRQYIAAYFRAYGAADAEVAELIEYSTARRQAKHRSDVAQMRQAGFRLKGTPRASVRRVRVEGDRATIRRCEWDKAAWFEDAKGNLRFPVKARWLPETVHLVKSDGHWKVDRNVDAQFSCKGAT